MTLTTRLRPVILLLLMLTALTGCQSSEREPRIAYNTVDLADQQNTERARAFNERALAAIEEGELEKAEQLLRQALTADVMFGPAHNNLGKVYFAQSQLYLAAWEFQYAAKAMPHQPEPRNNLGLVLERARRLDEAVTQYQAALEMAPDHPEILGNLLRARLRRGEHGDDLREQLKELILKDDRPQWVQWAKSQHARLEAQSGTP